MSDYNSPHSPHIFADNAGGSQVITAVIARITDYLIHTNVQLGADYSVGQQSTQRVADGAIAAKELFNASFADEVAFLAPPRTYQVQWKMMYKKVMNHH